MFRSVAALRPATGSTSQGGRAFDSAAAAAALERLGTALDNYDASSAGAALAGLDAAGIGDLAGDDVRQLRQAIEDYEYAGAREIVTRLLARFQGQP